MTARKFVIFGLEGSGKSNICFQYTQNTFVPFFDPTCEDYHRKQIMFDDIVDVIEIIDTAGEEGNYCFNRNYIENTQAFILVFSITSRISFDEISKYWNFINKETNQPIPIVLVGNKSDLQRERQISMEEAKEYADIINCEYIECSAKERYNIEEIFTTLLVKAREVFSQEKKHKKNDNKCKLM